MSWNLLPERPGRAPSDDLRKRRELAGRMVGRDQPKHSIRSIAGVRCLQVGSASPACEIVYFHGGGYRMGSADSWLGLAGALERSTGSRVTLPDYRLAPEHPFPAALNDALSVYQALSASGAPVFVAGDSAGGGLAAAVAVQGPRTGLPQLRGLVLFSPWLDLTLESTSYSTRAESDKFFPLSSARDAADAYLQGHPATDPLVSPARADLDAFPPTLVMAGTEETLLGDSLNLARRLAEARREVTLHIAAGMQHAWPAISPDLPETADAIEAVGAFIGRLLPGRGAVRAHQPVA